MAATSQRVGGGTVANPYTYSVAPDWANRPVNYVSFWDSLRFANWLHNGQGSSSTETGAYTMGSLGLVGVPTSPPVTHTVGAKYWLPTENEWYKAAYYKGGGTDSGYWGYTTQSNDFPSNTGSDGYTDPGNSANSAGVAPYYRTKVGEFENSASAYGTFDQGGNVGEWNEAIADQESGITFRGLRGGSFNYPDSIRNAPIGNDYDYIDPNEERSDVGFRVASVPEPGSVTLLVCGATGGLICYWRRRLR